VLARWTLDLFSAEAIVALQVLFAMRAGKLEIAHGSEPSRKKQIDNAAFSEFSASDVKPAASVAPGVSAQLNANWRQSHERIAAGA
jgi:hypothetical protein